MSNPCINRWGLNLYWHHYWYSDVRYGANAHQDEIFLKLMQIYLVYGLNSSATLGFNKYWFRNSTASNMLINNTQHHYRWLTLYNPTLQSVSTYRLRTENPEVFYAKTTVLKFNSWIVLNTYWFQPDKARNKSSTKAVAKPHSNLLSSGVRSVARLRKAYSTVTYAPRTWNAGALSYEF